MSHKAGKSAADSFGCSSQGNASCVPPAEASGQAQPGVSSAADTPSQSAGSSRPLQWQWLIGVLCIGYLMVCAVVHSFVASCVMGVVLGVTIVCYQDPSVLRSVTTALQPLFRVNCRMFGHRAVALVDSGASHSFVSRRWLLQCGLMDKVYQHASGDFDVTFADGRHQKSSLFVSGVDIALVNPQTKEVARFKLGFIVLDMEPDVVLGYDWLSTANPCIDWGQGVLRVAGRRSAQCKARARPVTIPVVKVSRAARTQRAGQLPQVQPPAMLSRMQVKRLLRKRDPQAWLAYARVANPVQEAESVASGSESESPSGVESVHPDVAQLLQEFADVFAEPSGVPPDRGVSHRIDLQSDKPVYRRPYRLSSDELQELKRQLSEMLEKGWIRPSTSPYGAPVLFVKKKDGTLRACADWRALNAYTVKARTPIPNVQDLFDQVNGAQVFTKLDLASGYHQVPIHPEDIHKTAIVTRYGQFEYTVMPFGLCNAPATFTALMNKVFAPFLDEFVVVYLDDILIYSKSIEQHVEHLRAVLTRLREQKLFAKLKKCEFARSSISYLGHIISKDGVATDPAKVAAVQEWPVPATVHDVRSFLGLCSYYRKFVPRFAEVAAPLTDLTKAEVKDVASAWGPKQQAAFEALKGSLTSTPVLLHADPSKPYVLRTDASDFAVGSVLMQEHDAQLHPVAFYSRKLSPAEARYGAYAREMLAVIDSLRHFEHYVDGRQVTVESDQQALSWFWSQRQLDKQQARWMAKLQAYDLQLKYIHGKLNLVADALSRRLDHRPAQLCSVSVASSTLLRSVLQAAAADAPYQEQLRAARSHHLPGYQAVQGVLYQVDSKGRTRIVLPASAHALKRAVLQEFHSVYSAGHPGFYKTLRKVSECFTWKGLLSDVKAYVASCAVCLACKSSTQVPIGLLQPLPVPTGKWEQISMDFVTGLPSVRSKVDAVLVVTDRLTKMVALVPTTKDVTAPQTAQLFVQHVFAHYGLPRVIVSDRDSRFVSAFWRALFGCLGTHLAFSSAYHPQSDGQTERVNRTMQQVLRCHCAQFPADWDKHLPMCQFVLNSAPHASTGFSPFQLMYGYQPRVPVTLATSGSTPVQAADEALQAMAEQLRVAQHNLERAQQQQRRQANKHRRAHTFAVGDRVMLSTQHLSQYAVPGKKLLPRFVGPFDVVQVVNPVAVRLALPPELSRIHPVFHVSFLRPVPPGAAVWHPDDSEEGPELVPLPAAPARRVESIIQHDYVRAREGTLPIYLVKWHGVPSWDAAWQSEEEILAADPTAADLIARYVAVHRPVYGVDTHLDTFDSDSE